MKFFAAFHLIVAALLIAFVCGLVVDILLDVARDLRAGLGQS